MTNLLLALTLILWGLQLLGILAISSTVLGILALITGILLLVTAFNVVNLPALPTRHRD